MKTFKHFFTLILAILMFVYSTNTTAFAKETDTDIGYPTIIEFEITPQIVDKNNSAIMPLNVDNTFHVTGSHTGSSRTYYGNTLRYQITVTDVNGNSANNILAIQLYDSTNYMMREYQVWADGSNYQYDIPISYGGKYYFKYLLAYGTTRTLKVHMVITAI